MTYKTIEKYFNSLLDDVTEINNANIKEKGNLPDLSRFHSLQVLWFPLNKLNTLPLLPNTVVTISISSNHLTSLPPLPSTLKQLSCYENQITELPPLPLSLEYLECSYNQLIKLPDLPSKLENLICKDNQLSELPPLPESLLVLDCDNNYLIVLPELPSKLKTLSCGSNRLKHLPELPSTLNYLECWINELTRLPLIPRTLTFLVCGCNLLPEWYEQEWETDIKVYVNKIITIQKFINLFYILKYKTQFRHWLWAKVREPKIKAKYHPDNLIKMLEENGEMEIDELDEMMEQW